MASILFFAGLGFFLAAAARLVWKGHTLSGLLLAVGALGWFAPIMLPAAGNRLRHVELPAVYETATIAGPTGRTFALTRHLSRLQRYDLAGRFEAGWFVDSGGGKVAIGVTSDGKVAVAAVRTRRVEFFNPDGSSAGPPRPFARESKNLMSGYLHPSEYRVDGVTFETPTVAKDPSIRWNTLLLFPLWGPQVAGFLAACGIVASIVAARGRLWGNKGNGLQSVSTAGFLVGLLFIVTPANAQLSQDHLVCSGQVPAAQPDQRVAACTAVIEAGGESPASLAVTYCARGVAYQARDQLNRAIADYDEAVRIAPKGATSYRCRGFANLARGATDDAIADFNEAIALDPRSASSFLGRGWAYRAKGDLGRAIADYDEALQLDAKNTLILNSRGAAMIHLRSYDRAIEDLSNAIRFNPSSSEAFNNRGLAYAHQGKHDRAIADFTEAIRLDPRYGAAYTNRGVAYTAKGEGARAKADFDQAKILSGR